MDRNSLLEVVRDCESVVEVAERLGVSSGFVYSRMQLFGIATDELKEPEVASPTPDEIASRAAEVRAGWSERETARRAGAFASRGWSLPSFSYDGRTKSFSERAVASAD
jgi:hypothetical protein